MINSRAPANNDSLSTTFAKPNVLPSVFNAVWFAIEAECKILLSLIMLQMITVIICNVKQINTTGFYFFYPGFFYKITGLYTKKKDPKEFSLGSF
jgi:hypothetical protein